MKERLRISRRQKDAVWTIRRNLKGKWFRQDETKIPVSTLEALVDKGFLKKREIPNVELDPKITIMAPEYYYIGE